MLLIIITTVNYKFPLCSNIRVLIFPWLKKKKNNSNKYFKFHFLGDMNSEMDYNIKSETSPLVERKFSQKTYITRR